MQPKRIMVDGHNLSLEKGTGIATYARNLTYNIHHLGHRVELLYGYNLPSVKHGQAREMSFFDPPDARFGRLARRIALLRGLFNAYRPRVALPVPSTDMIVTDGLKARLPYFDTLWNCDNLFNNAGVTHSLLKRNEIVRLYGTAPNIMHWTYPVAAELQHAKNIYTIHDLVPMRLPFTTLDHNRRFVDLVKRIARKADHIVTVSETSKRDIVNLLGVPKDRVTNTFQAVEIPEQYALKSPEIVEAEVKGVFDLDYKRYLLFFGAIEPKKNIARMIEAYLASGIDDPLIIVGSKAWKYEAELKLLPNDDVQLLERVGRATMMRPKRRIIHFDYAPFPLLVSLIKGAKFVVAPSLYEGFGLPALEAMLLGTPVITSNQGASPEIVGDGALTVDPYKPREIRDAMLALDGNPELRAEMSAKGIRQAQLFSNEAYRKRLAALYERL